MGEQLTVEDEPFHSFEVSDCPHLCLPPLFLPPRLGAGGPQRVLRAAQEAAGGGREARADPGEEAGDDRGVCQPDGPEPPGGAQQVQLGPLGGGKGLAGSSQLTAATFGS